MDQPDQDRQAEPASDSQLVEAVRRWQCGRDGSSLLRGVARVITGVSHYFDADFITGYERAAERDDHVRSQARLLIDEIANADARSDRDWHASQGLPGEAFRAAASSPSHNRTLRSSSRSPVVS
jgi:hypothetical protein